MMEDTVKKLLEKISELSRERGNIIIAIDGRCGAGKSTLAERLASVLHCTLIHTDEFFLRSEQRTAERYAEPGGNFDRERFYTDVLARHKQREVFEYRPFNCHTMELGEPITVIPREITIVEGTYSCHPEFRELYDMRVFLTVSPDCQTERIAKRDGADTEMFKTRWIPLEEQYFKECCVKENCDMVFETE